MNVVGRVRLNVGFLRNGEDEKLAAAFGVGGQILHRAGKAQGAVPHSRVDIGVGDGAGPAADAVEDGDILPAVAAFVGDGLADEARSRPGTSTSTSPVLAFTALNQRSMVP